MIIKENWYDKDNNYKIVSDDLYKNGIFTDDENEIANNIARKIKPKENIEQAKNKKKNNFELKSKVADTIQIIKKIKIFYSNW